MDSQHEEISSILERFRHYLTNNDGAPVLKEFHEYRQTWSTNKFRMFLNNVLIVMRGWASNRPAIVVHDVTFIDWNDEATRARYSTPWDRMQTSSHQLFLAMVDYLRSAVLPDQPDRMSRDSEFDLWKLIVTNCWTMHEEFYNHIFEQSVPLPPRLTGVLHNDMYDFYLTTGQWSSAGKIRLLELGFLHLLIHENVFLGCNHILPCRELFSRKDYLAFAEFSQKNPEIYQRKLITSINSPEKMKIFLDFYPNVDLAELVSGNSDLYQQRTPLTLFDRLLKMEIFYYESSDLPTLVDVPDFTSDLEKVQAANMLYLYQKFTEKGAKISITLDTAYYQTHRMPFFVSTLGCYLLSMIRFRDIVIIPSIEIDVHLDGDPDILFSALLATGLTNSTSLNVMSINHLHYLIKRASTFAPQFRAFFLHHLALCCPLVHCKAFAGLVESTANPRLRLLYDEVLQQRGNLTLKQRCRLLIKQAINQYPLGIQKLSSLPVSLQSYLAFDLFHPNFVPMTLAKLSQVQGRVKPIFFDEYQFHEHNLAPVNAHFDWEDQIPDDMDEDEDDDETDEDDEDDEYDNEDADLFDEELHSDNHDDDEEEEW